MIYLLFNIKQAGSPHRKKKKKEKVVVLESH